MTLLNMAALGWLSLALPLILIYLLKIKPTRKLTTAMFLWDEVLQEKKSSALFKRLRDLLSLLLLLMTLLLVVLAMSEPVMTSDQSKDFMIILDSSASMQTVHGHETRFELAKEEAESILEAMSVDRKVILASASNQIRTIVNRTANLKLLLEGLKRMQPTIHSLEPQHLTDLLSQKEFTDQFRIIFITDSSTPGFKHADRMEIIHVGQNVDNTGIIAFDVRHFPGKHQQMAVFFKCTSTKKQAFEVDLVLSHEKEDNVVKVFPVTITPNQVVSELYDVNQAPNGRWLLSIDGPGDANPLDDKAFAILPPLIPVRTMVQGEQSYFFTRVVQAFSDYENSLQLVDRDADLMITNGPVKNMDMAKHFIIFNPKKSSPFWKSVGKEIESTHTILKQEGHPILKFIDTESISFKGAKEIKCPSKALILLENQDGIPLIYTLKFSTHQICVINMDPQVSDFFLNAYFPILVYSIAHHQMGFELDASPSHPPGSVIQKKGLGAQLEVNLLLPNGTLETHHSDHIGPFNQLGFYQIQKDKLKEDVACSVIGQNETLLNAPSAKTTLGPIEKGISPTNLLILIALFILLAESILYHKRKVG